MKEHNYSLKDFQGTYRGFTPTDESPIAMGELEVKIDENSIAFRQATGLKIISDKFGLEKLSPMNHEDIVQLYTGRSDAPDTLVGFSAGSIKYLFCPNPGEEDIGLLIRGNEMADILGPTVLFSPSQVEKGDYANAVKEVNDQFPNYPAGCFPTLAAGGKMPTGSFIEKLSRFIKKV